MDVKATIHTLIGQPIIVREKTFSDWQGDLLCNVDEASAAILLSVNGWAAVAKPEPAPAETHAVEPVRKKVRGKKEAVE